MYLHMNRYLSFRGSKERVFGDVRTTGVSVLALDLKKA